MDCNQINHHKNLPTENLVQALFLPSFDDLNTLVYEHLYSPLFNITTISKTLFFMTDILFLMNDSEDSSV